jgi:hypothetical protein
MATAIAVSALRCGWSVVGGMLYFVVGFVMVVV